MNHPKFFVHRNFGSVELHFRSRCGDEGRYFTALPVVIESRNFSDGAHAEPMLSLGDEDGQLALQSLMDGLWEIGIRPSDIGTPGHLAATTKHLEDMRAIAFSKLEVQKP